MVQSWVPLSQAFRLQCRSNRWPRGNPLDIGLQYRPLGEVCGGDFETEFARSAFGITHSLPFVADKVRVLIQIEAVRQ